MNTIKNPSRRMARWIDEFQQYDLEFVYRKGKEAVVPDAISRHPLFQEGQVNTLEEEELNQPQDSDQERVEREEEWLRGLKESL